MALIPMQKEVSYEGTPDQLIGIERLSAAKFKIRVTRFYQLMDVDEAGPLGRIPA
jgi:hypothetical protein